MAATTRTRTGNGILDLELPVPTEMGRPSEATNPEQLFAAGYAACFHSALKVVAQRDKLFDVETSELLWHDQLPAGGQATPMPMSYEFEGGRYVVFSGGSGG